MINNQLIIDSQNMGKTTYLFNKIDRFLSKKYNIIILDSATEHEDKSLLKKVINKYNNSVCINISNPNIVDINKCNINDYIYNYKNHFPFKEINENKEKIICFDLSYFLEKGHDKYDETGDINLYNYYRKIYNNLAQQITLMIIILEKYDIINNSVVVMDEIEFPIVDYDISILQKDIQFLGSVHPENAFGTFYKSFEKVKFKEYTRKD